MCASPASPSTSPQGATQLTGRSTDFAIQGDGFFAVDQGGQTAYTRNGSFSLDANGNLVTADGAFVEGWQADQNGNVSTNATVGHLKIPVGQIINPITTTTMKIGGNLPADAAVGTVDQRGDQRRQQPRHRPCRCAPSSPRSRTPPVR